MKHYIALGKVVLVKGDALSPEDVKAAWDKAAEQQKIDFVLFTIGESCFFLHIYKMLDSCRQERTLRLVQQRDT